jgi:hypothetical protein
MRGQAARWRRIIRAIGASPNGLTATEIAHREEAGFRTIDRDLEALRGGSVYPECREGRPLGSHRHLQVQRSVYSSGAKKHRHSESAPLFLLLPKAIDKMLLGCTWGEGVSPRLYASFRFIHQDVRAHPAVRAGGDLGLPDGGEQSGKGRGPI